MKLIASFLFACAVFFASGQIRIYSGNLGKYPITLVTQSYSDGFSKAIYAYSKYDTPIRLMGQIEQKNLVLLESNLAEEVTATFDLPNYQANAEQLNGSWTAKNKGKQLKIRLTKTAQFEDFDSAAFKDLEMMQSESTKKHYFTLKISKQADEMVRVTAVQVYEKKSDQLLQSFEVDCELMGLENIQVDDYNFDGILDFSIFESSYAGPNTSSIYFLSAEDGNSYFKSDYSGTSLEFDPEKKIVTEVNSCCAGTKIMQATYQVVNNQLVLINKICLEYTEDTEEYKEVTCD